MHLRNQKTHWGLIAVSLHFISALVIFGLFALGWWMTDLTYYDPWYKNGPFIHKSIGILFFMLVIVRVTWRLYDHTPDKNSQHAQWEIRIAKITHQLLYGLIFIIMISGYLISTADGRSIDVFNLLSVPASLQSIPRQEDIAGAIHWFGACILMGLSSLHILGALKHHYFDKDATLLRMLGRPPK